MTQTPEPMAGGTTASDAVDLELAASGRTFIRCSCRALFVSGDADEVEDLYNLHHCPNIYRGGSGKKTVAVADIVASCIGLAVIAILIFLFLWVS